MTIKKITAIINEMQLDNVAKVLCEHSVTGFTIHPVTGEVIIAIRFQKMDWLPINRLKYIPVKSTPHK